MDKNNWWDESGWIVGYVVFLVWWVRWYFHCFPYYLREKEEILWRMTKWEWDKSIRDIQVILGLEITFPAAEMIERHTAINKDMNELQDEINEVFGLGK